MGMQDPDMQDIDDILSLGKELRQPEIDELKLELAALKSRSCSGCRWWQPLRDGHWMMTCWESRDRDPEMQWNCSDATKDHCSRWEKKEDGDVPPT